MSRTIKLNVGGVQYTTSVTTLAQYPESMLAVMIGQENERHQIESGEELFIDRNGHVFKYVLEFLRNGNRLILPNDLAMQRALSWEAEFYQLDGLKRLIDERRQSIAIVKLNVGGTRYEVPISTLMQYPDSMLGKLIQQPHELQMIHDGEEIFINRDGEMFKYVLHYLRDGNPFVLPDDGDETILKQLLVEAMFFQLDGLKAIVPRKLELTNREGWKIGDYVSLEKDVLASTKHVFDDMKGIARPCSTTLIGKIVQFRNDGNAVVRVISRWFLNNQPPNGARVREITETYVMSLRRKK